MFRVVARAHFRIYASANLVSLTGTWMQRIGQDWLVLQLSGDSGIALGLITALQFGPSLLSACTAECWPTATPSAGCC